MKRIRTIGSSRDLNSTDVLKMAALKDNMTTKLAPDAVIVTKKTITAAAAGVTTRRAALGDIGNRVLNRNEASKVGLAKKDSDGDLKKPIAAKVDARRPLRSNSVTLNTTKPVVAVPAKPPLNDISKNRVLAKQNSSMTNGVQSKVTSTNATIIKAEIHQPSSAAMPSQQPRHSILQKRESFISNGRTKASIHASKSTSGITSKISQQPSLQNKKSSTEAAKLTKESDSRVTVSAEQVIDLQSAAAIETKQQPLPITASASVTDDKEPLKDPQAYSVAWIPDIDADDRLFPQLVSEFVNEIYEYMRELEIPFQTKFVFDMRGIHGNVGKDSHFLSNLKREQHIKQDFLAGNDITGRMRGILIDWLIQVHMRFHLLPETMYMTVMIIDRYLQEVKIAKDQLQLVGITALFLASKYEEIYAPEIGDFVYIADNAYTKDNVRHMERLMLRTLGFNLGRPSAIHFLRRYSKAAEADDLKHTMAKFFLELSFQEYNLAHIHPSLVAAAALYLSQVLLDGSPWTSILVHYTTYSEAEVLPVVKILCQILVSVYDKNSKLQAVRNKYSSRKFLEISQHTSLSEPLIRQMAVKD